MGGCCPTLFHGAEVYARYLVSYFCFLFVSAFCFFYHYIISLFIDEKTDTSYLKDVTSIPEDQMRLFLLNFVKRKGLDPLLTETWYKLNDSEIAKDKVYSQSSPFSFLFHCVSLLIQIQRGKVILQKYKGYVNAVRCLITDVQFDSSSFAECKYDPVPNIAHYNSFTHYSSFI